MKAANYTSTGSMRRLNGDYYHYAYDTVGNRETQTKSVLGFVTNDTYVYDDANRLASFNGVIYTCDHNAKLLNNGVNTYTYDWANRVKTLSALCQYPHSSTRKHYMSDLVLF